MGAFRTRMTAAGSAVVAAGVLALTAPAGASAAPSAASHTDKSLLQVAAPGSQWRMTQSNNWSGYNQGALEKGHQFTSISGTWTVPTATQHKNGQAEQSATWVGIGGGCLDTSCTVTDPTLIQAGTGQDVDASGKATYYTWYELIPAPSINTPLAVEPGDSVTVSINQTLPGVWSIAIKNNTTGKSWSTTTPYPSTMGSAEWIEETPLIIDTSNTGIAAMPNLGTVRFSNAKANGAPAHLTSSEALQLIDSQGHVLATPSAPLSSGTAFNDCTYASSC